MRHVFITGGSGFIGNAIATAFKQNGDKVTCLCQSAKSKSLLEQQGFTTVLGDMSNPKGWSDVAEGAEVIVHAAHVRAGMRLSKGWLKKSTEFRDAALKGLITAAKKGGNCKALIYTSGMIAHGDHGDRQIDETTTPNETALGRYHLDGEAIITSAAKDGVPALSIRPGMVYGPKGTFGKFFLTVAQKGKYQYPGSGDNYLPFVHVNDLAKAYVLASQKAPSGHIINVVDDSPITVKDMAAKLLSSFNGGKASSVPSWVVGLFAGNALAEMLTGSYRVQNSKAKELLDWQPKYKTFADGIGDVVGEFKTLGAA
ncbi:NAD-dependent epimerase/dehydratase family protein [Teredinibacter waterburyi]|jgi:Nucleoside-diphosphate-sugar epimerases|uniref:NAD-dependent epimerase/dehydratase family protein n=1 Tax=Teredinibacter waterburyi TaxID=1500538 RepID=UPI00165ED1B9|nr:NAD-dependent epimerase/dehydratase family protein [Teredinibacter waterburyi]